MELQTELYYATSAENVRSVAESTTICPPLDGSLHLTTNLNKAIASVWMQDRTEAAVFRVNPRCVHADKIHPFTAGMRAVDDCYIYKGELRGVELMGVYSPPLRRHVR